MLPDKKTELSGTVIKRDTVIRSDLVAARRLEEKRALRDYRLTIVLIVMCLIVVWTKYVWLEPILVDGTSMNDTLDDGDLLVLDRLANPNRGDVIVFTHGSTSYIKRVVGLGGDTVRIENGKLYLRKKGSDEFVLCADENAKGKTFMYEYSGIYRTELMGTFDFEVEEGEFFALGDNREGSVDCRHPRLGGALPLSEIDGVVHRFFIEYKDTSLAVFYKFL